MKKKIFMAAAIFSVAVMFSGCITSFVIGVTEATKETEEVASGKVFQVATGTVTYSNGNVLTFRNEGREWVYASGNEIIVVKGEKTYRVDLINETYEVFAEKISCPLVFLEKTYEFGEAYDDEVRKSTLRIAGKTCTAFTFDSGDCMAGWKRVLFLDDSADLEAKSWSDLCDTKMFDLSDYTEE